MCGENRDDDSSDGTFGLLVVSTVSLMSTWATMPERDEVEREERDFVATKIAMSLYQMLMHPDARGPMACSLAQARQRWLHLLGEAVKTSADPARAKSVMH